LRAIVQVEKLDGNLRHNSHFEMFMPVFFENLHQEVLRDAEHNDTAGLLKSFTNWVLEMLREHTISGGEAVHYRSRDALSGIDAFCLSEDQAHLDVFISAYYREQTEIQTEEVEELLELGKRFISTAKSGFHARNLPPGDPVIEVANCISEAQGSLVRERIFLLTNAQTDTAPRINDADSKLVCEVWDIRKIEAHCSSKRQIVKLDFENNYGGPVACVGVEEGTGEYRTFLAFFRGDLLARIYGTYSHKLLEQNVRVFLQAKGPINKGLQKTLAEEPGRFLAYNNGLCCTAAAVEVRTNASGHAFLHSVTDFQIVNGGQTTSSLDLYNRKGDPDNLKRVWVQVKITVIHDPEKVDEIVPLISRYANSQNKVSGADFSANGPFHKALQTISRNTEAPSAGVKNWPTIWYYERAKGAYADERARNSPPKSKSTSKKNTNDSDWEKRHPVKQKLTKTDVAKLEHCWSGNPFYTCLGADKSFRKMAEQFESGEPDVTPAYFKNLVAKAIIWNSIEGQFDFLKLKGCRSQTVAYIFAFLATKSDKRINLNLVWDKQQCQQGMLRFITDLCSSFHNTLMSNNGVPDCPGAGNQLAKTEKYWKKFFETKNGILIPVSWRSEWAKTPFEVIYKMEDGLALEWERVRWSFTEDRRAMGELANKVQKKWIASRNSEIVSVWAGKSWAEITRVVDFGPKKRTQLVDLFSAAFQSRD